MGDARKISLPLEIVTFTLAQNQPILTFFLFESGWRAAKCESQRIQSEMVRAGEARRSFAA